MYFEGCDQRGRQEKHECAYINRKRRCVLLLEASFFFAVVKEFECCLVTAPAGPSANMQIFPPHQGNSSKGYQTLESPTGIIYAPFGFFFFLKDMFISRQ